MSRNYDYGAAPQQSDNYGTPYSTYTNTQEQHELQNYPQQHQQPAATTLLSQQDFLSRVSQVRDELRNLVTDVNRTSQLQQAALSGADDNAASQRRLDDSTAATQARINGIRGQLRALKDDVEATPRGASGADTKKKQWEHLNRDFQKELQAYLDEERNFRQRYRDQIARQYRIVNPDAPEEEVRRAAEMDWGNEGVFQSALRNNRTGQANAVLGNVRARHNELLEIERSINELVILIQDLNTIVVQQDAPVQDIENQVEGTVGDLRDANKELDIANEKARHRRKLKWICSGIVVLIVLGIALGVGLGVGLIKNPVGSGSSSGSNATTTRRSVEELELLPAAAVIKLPVGFGGPGLLL